MRGRLTESKAGTWRRRCQRQHLGYASDCLARRFEGGSAPRNVGGTSEGWQTAAAAAADQYSQSQPDEGGWYTGSSMAPSSGEFGRSLEDGSLSLRTSGTDFWAAFGPVAMDKGNACFEKSTVIRQGTCAFNAIQAPSYEAPISQAYGKEG